MINLLPESYQGVFGSLIIMLGIFGILGLIVHIPGSNRKETFKRFQEEEREANMADNKPLPKELVRTIDISFLQFSKLDYTNLETASVKKIEFITSSLLDMNNLQFVFPQPGVSNTELKLEFGPATLQKFISLEQNYNNYIQKLIDFSSILYECKLYDMAETVVIELTNLKCSTSKPYLTLIDIYVEQGNKEKLKNLYEKVENSDFFDINEYSRKKILFKINEML